MTGAARLLGLAAGLLVLLVGCESNEHPFDSWWGVACLAPEAPAMNALFQEPRQYDDVGNKREYSGRVEVTGPDFPDVWLWQVEIDLHDQTASTLAFEHVPVPDEYVTGEPAFQTLDFDVRTFFEDDERTTATMTGECTWGGESGELSLVQTDDCDLCFDCNTGRAAPSGGLLAPLLLLLARRRGASRAPG